jgi:RNA polymerase sigma-70 factor (ECF subfamily)
MSTSGSVARLVLLQGGTAADQPTTDEQLAQALIRGDTGTSQQAWMRFLPMVRGQLRRILGPGLDEDDLSQEVFLRFFQRVGGLREPAAVRGFLFAICLRVAKKELRRRWLRRWLRLTDDGTLPEDPGRPNADALEREARDALKRYYAILDTVGGRGRSLFVARYIEGMDLAQVSRMHGLSVSTAQRRLGRVAARVDAMVRRDPVLSELAGHDEAGHRERNDHE